ncbi:MAG TPA: hypothetical protein VI935_10975, partial [Thermodesulfobacteriota bacterium]|nr:hypothetical protein [Thermodesulfobacteriota bacterium]
PPIIFGSKVILSNVAISIYLLYIQTKLIKFSIPIVTSVQLEALHQSIFFLHYLLDKEHKANLQAAGIPDHDPVQT